MVNRRYCAVPGCRSSSKRSPFKAFFSVPLEIEERKKWLQAMCRSPSDFSDKSHLDICEDHFNVGTCFLYSHNGGFEF
uniref:Unkown protein n=1 Tax=Riptortus pedestris TaxID=329032 RepID=R4WU06_RIPPE|nr:unkown protein [Riptortus pedestris]